MRISNFNEVLRKKSQLRQFTWLVATESTQRQFLIVSYFFASFSILLFWSFFSIFCKSRIPGFHEFIVKMMTSWSLWVCRRDYRYFLTEVIEYQEHLDSHSETVGFLGIVGLRPMEHSNLNIYQNVKKEKKMFILLKMAI